MREHTKHIGVPGVRDVPGVFGLRGMLGMFGRDTDSVGFGRDTFGRSRLMDRIVSRTRWD